MAQIAIVTPSLDRYSETFIRAHIEQLPAHTHVLYGGHFPTYAGDEALLSAEHSFIQRVRFRLMQQLRGLPWDGAAKHTAAVEAFLRNHRIQAVLAEYGPTGVAMMPVCKNSEIPLIVHFHGYDAYRQEILDGPAGQQYPALFQAATAVVVVSHAMHAKLLRLGAPEEKIHYVSYGVDTSLFSASSPGSNAPTFIGVGRFVNKKAPYLTLLAFAEVLRAVPEARLILVGEGELQEPCQRIAQALDIAKAVDFRGICPHSEVAALMQKARAFVQHSVVAFSGDSEGTPVAIIEAGAAGLPVVATRHAGIPDVVVEGETGFLINEGDVAQMAAYMIQLAQDPSLAARMGRAARQRVETCFAMNQSIDNLWNIIKSAIGVGGDAHGAR